MKPGGWFGPTWDAPVCEPHRHRETPVGTECHECRVAIVDGDQGVLIPFSHNGQVEEFALHLNCLVLGVLLNSLEDVR